MAQSEYSAVSENSYGHGQGELATLVTPFHSSVQRKKKKSAHFGYHFLYTN